MSTPISSCSGLKHFATLPSKSQIAELRVDDGYLTAETVAGEIFRIDTEGRVSRTN